MSTVTITPPSKRMAITMEPETTITLRSLAGYHGVSVGLIVRSCLNFALNGGEGSLDDEIEAVKADDRERRAEHGRRSMASRWGSQGGDDE